MMSRGHSGHSAVPNLLWGLKLTKIQSQTLPEGIKIQSCPSTKDAKHESKTEMAAATSSGFACDATSPGALLKTNRNNVQIKQYAISG